MKLRQQRGSLDDSMATVIDIPDSMQALALVIKKELDGFDVSVTESSIKVEPYGYDQRIDWDTHIVTIDGFGVFGFTDKLPQ